MRSSCKLVYATALLTIDSCRCDIKFYVNQLIRRRMSYQGGDTRIPLTRWSVGHVWQDKHQSGRFFVFIRQYARICLYMKRHDLGQNPNELLVTSRRHLFAKLDFFTVLCRLINCSTQKTASYNYSLEKLLWNMKFYLNQYFSQTSSHEIVRRNVKLTRENLNLGSKIKHLSPVYRERHRKAAQTTAKLVSSESKNEPNTT